MKINTTYRKILLLVALLICGSAIRAQETVSPDTADVQLNKPDTIGDLRHWFDLRVIARTYGDRVYIRWAPDEYVPWKFLNGYGYMVQRVTRLNNGDLRSDTIAACVHPISRKQFMERFAENDSLAGAAVQTIFGQETTLDQTEHAPGTPGSIMEVYEEQQNIYGFAMLIADLRPDLAEAMGLAYTDRDVRPGVSYDYIIRPLVPDSVLPVYPGIVRKIRNDSFKPTNFNTVLSDSIEAPSTVRLYWPRDNYTAYDIERRNVDGGEWTRLNERPYISMLGPTDSEDRPNLYLDAALKPGTYEYRIRAYDSFGDRTNPSDVLRVEMPDLVAPVAPWLKRIEITHGDSVTLARLFWGKDSLEEDMVGYLPVYYNEQLLADRWLPLSGTLIEKTDTTCVVDVTGLGTGSVAIVALDQAGNMGASLPQTLRIGDLTPPMVPKNLRAITTPDGVVTLLWTAVPDRDLYSYEVWYANAPNHEFSKISPIMMKDTIYQDTISIRNNQRYVYYKVKAVDWSSNASEFTEVLPVTVPDFTPPLPCRIDSTYYDDEVIRIWWLASNEASVKWHRVYRKLASDPAWTLLKEIDADTLKSVRFLIEDKPDYVQNQRYYYAVETLSLMGSSSGLSMQQSILFNGPRVIDVPIKLYGDYNQRTGESHLAWETGKTPADAPFHYCVYRKGPTDDDFKFLLSAKSDTPSFADRLTRPGETAEYYVSIRFKDGRGSTPSNTVKIKAPKK